MLQPQKISKLYINVQKIIKTVINITEHHVWIQTVCNLCMHTYIKQDKPNIKKPLHISVKVKQSVTYMLIYIIHKIRIKIIN